MARRFLDDLRADIINYIIDNDAGLITPAQVRTALLDIIDSTIQDEGAIIADHTAGAPYSFTATPTWTALPTAIWNGEVGGDADFVKVNEAGGEISSSSTAGWTYVLQGVISIVAANNADIEFAIGTDGDPTGTPITVTGRGSNRPVYGRCFRYDVSALANSSYQLFVRSPTGGSEAIEVDYVALICVIQPTNNP